MYVKKLHVECESWKVFGKTFWTTSQKSKVKSQKFNVLSKFEIVVVVWDGGAKKHTSYVLTKLKKLINNKTLF